MKCIECGDDFIPDDVCKSCRQAERMSSLAPCPFCGSEAFVSNDESYGWLVRCVDCMASGPSSSTREGAVTFWNERAFRYMKVVEQDTTDMKDSW